MKIKYISVTQIVLLLGTLTAGLLLKGNLADGPRLLHRLIGMLAGITGICLALVLIRQKATVAQRVNAWAAVAFTALAGFAGMRLKSTDDYDRMFNFMRGSGILALIIAISVLVMIHKAASVKTPIAKEEESVDGN